MAIMFVAELAITPAPEADSAQVVDALRSLAGYLWRNGQSMGHETISECGSDLRAFVLVPDWNALDEAHNNNYVTEAYAKLAEVSRARTRITILGDVPDSKGADTCVNPASYILLTGFQTQQSALRCGDCLAPIPLYKIPATDGRGEYTDLLGWQEDYQACDTLWIHSGTGERFGTRQMSDINSSLSKEGREICAEIEEATGKPTFYYLHRWLMNPSWKKERARRGPGCGGEWFLEEPWHNFDFKCEPCRLVSHVSGGTPR